MADVVQKMAAVADVVVPDDSNMRERQNRKTDVPQAEETTGTHVEREVQGSGGSRPVLLGGTSVCGQHRQSSIRHFHIKCC